MVQGKKQAENSGLSKKVGSQVGQSSGSRVAKSETPVSRLERLERGREREVCRCPMCDDGYRWMNDVPLDENRYHIAMNAPTNHGSIIAPRTYPLSSARGSQARLRQTSTLVGDDSGSLGVELFCSFCPQHFSSLSPGSPASPQLYCISTDPLQYYQSLLLSYICFLLMDVTYYCTTPALKGTLATFNPKP